ncbi:hypothetical protein CAPTEDRAFT_202091 [Capitella teleta]|uniref:Uncharacterized protein n=1 Tax=Capitella teleta TaxID=283909 RepID=R7VJ09_CAPTE|nr:hypothetical protein CAPTEDRAFT_202091 [Capitella teleta]|eukprot:ELU16291.1 hypothetical protein CAPTEDRAFT_202091 [Capitella teleta]
MDRSQDELRRDDASTAFWCSSDVSREFQKSMRLVTKLSTSCSVTSSDLIYVQVKFQLRILDTAKVADRSTAQDDGASDADASLLIERPEDVFGPKKNDISLAFVELGHVPCHPLLDLRTAGICFSFNCRDEYQECARRSKVRGTANTTNQWNLQWNASAQCTQPR